MQQNTDYIIMLKNPLDLTQIKILAQQMYPHAVDKKNFSHLVVDLKPYTNSVMRRAKILNLFPIVHIQRNL